MDQTNGSQDAPVVYVASALSGDVTGNVERTKKYSRFVADQGACPLNPILNLHGVISEETGRDLAIEIDLHLLRKCADELWTFGEPTAGMKREIEVAKNMNLPIRRFSTDLKEIKNGQDTKVQ